MSIYRFTGGSFAVLNRVSAFYNFLDSIKDDVNFMDGVSLSLSGNTITMQKNDVIIKINRGTVQSSDFGYYSYTNGTVTLQVKKAGGDYNRASKISIQNAIVCNNGMIIQICVSNDDGSSLTTIGYWTITLDSNGELSTNFPYGEISWNDPPSGTPIAAIRIIVGDSTGVLNFNPNTQYSQTKTSLTPIVPITLYGNTTVPDFYISVQSELPNRALQAVSMENVVYITDGSCFLKDSV